jgi:serine/threonine-protein kinase
MSPEQIEGHDADARADIFAFGCVLYEMLTGKKAFEGKTQASLIAAILERTPVPIPMLQPVTPPALAHVVDECLRKNPARRWASIHDVALELQWIAEEGTGAVAAAAAPPPRSRARAMAMGITAAALVILAASAAWLLKPTPSSAREVARFSIVLPDGVNFSRAGRHVLTMSADGRKLVFVANQQLYVRSLDQDTAVPIRGTTVDPADPTFSPDGSWVAFWSNNQIRKVPVAGGSPVTVCDAPLPYGLHWNGDRIFIGAGPRGILAVAAAGGATTEIVPPGKGGELAAHPQLLPDGDSLLFTWRSRPNWNDAQIVVESLTSHRRKVILQGGSNATFVPTGHLVFAHDNALFAEAFDPRVQEVRGGPIAIVDDVSGVGVNSGPIGAAQVAISRTGTVAYLPGNLIGGRRLAWVDRAGGEEPIQAPARVYFNPRISPDGSRLAAEARDEENDIWVWDFARATLTRLTFGASAESYPVWTPDSRRIIYASNRDGVSSLYWQAADGTGEAERLTKGGQFQAPNSTSPDGKYVVFREISKSGSDSNLLALPLDGDRTPRTLLATPAGELNGEISPDGRWFVYESSESGRIEVYVRPWPALADGRWQVSANSGRAPLWSHDGRELFFLAADLQLMAVAVETKSTFVFGEARKLFDTSKYITNAGGRPYDVAQDGKRFIMPITAVPRGDFNRIAVVENWFEELETRVPVK